MQNLIQHSASVEADYQLVRAVVRMEKSAVRHLAVVDRRKGSKLVGLLTMSDVVRAHAHAALDAGDPDPSVVPGFTEAVGNQIK